MLETSMTPYNRGLKAPIHRSSGSPRLVKGCVKQASLYPYTHGQALSFWLHDYGLVTGVVAVRTFSYVKNQ